MKVDVISVETIQPSSPVHDMEPFKLSLLDQLTPITYSPLVYFYTTDEIGRGGHLKQAAFQKISSRLKWSLSKTLSSYYPLSGRLKDKLFIHDFDRGVPFTVARAEGCLFGFLQKPRLELLNRFLPCQPFCQVTDPTGPQVAVQLNIFDCGGIALGICLSHKVLDGSSINSFLRSWAANTNGSLNEVVLPGLTEASSLFPPEESMPPHHASLIENFWFTEGTYTTRRFVFDANAIAVLKGKSKSELVENPTRTEALCTFIWKRAMAASRSISGSPSPSFLTQSVNLRSSLAPNNSFGNLIWSSIAAYDDSSEPKEMQLVGRVRDSVAKLKIEFSESNASDIDSHGGSGVVFEQLDREAEIFNGHPQVFAFSSWLAFRYHDLDFGWGKPIWVGLFGVASADSPTDSNFTVLNQSARDQTAVEAWMTLDVDIMALLEQDPEFLKFASPNPGILSAIEAQHYCCYSSRIASETSSSSDEL